MRRLLFLTWVLLLISRSSAADSAVIAIHATVLPHASVEVLSTLGSVTVTAEDVRRGFVNVDRATDARVRTNSRAGSLLVVELAQTGPFVEALVQGAGPDTNVRGQGWIPLEYAGPQGLPLRLTYRFALPSDALPGTYACLVQLSALPR